MSVMEKTLTAPEVFTPVSYYDKRVINATAPRWVGNPLDLIVSERKAEISWLKVGGEETNCVCLQRYGRTFIPRGRAALLELGGDPIPMRHLGDLQSVAWQGISFSEEVAKNNFGFVPVFPGDGLKVLKRYSMNPIRRGIDELTTLANKQWTECHTGFAYCPDGHVKTEEGSRVFGFPDDSTECPKCGKPLEVDAGSGILDVIEMSMFGDGIEPTLKGLENQIKSAVVPEVGIDVGKYKSEWLTMCEDARNWGMRQIAIEHGLLKAGHVGEWQGGWTYSYSPVAEMLMAQLEVTRQDQPLHEMSKLIERMVPQSNAGISAVDMELIDKRFEEKMEARLAAAREADARRIAELEAILAAEKAKTVEAARSADDSLLINELLQKAAEPEVFTCEKCGKECASRAGQKAHERSCDAKPSEE